MTGMNKDDEARQPGLPGIVLSSDGLGPDARVVTRDPHRGSDSYEASMLRNLLARIHRDGGHYLEQHGLDKALEDADARIAELLRLDKCLAGWSFERDEMNRIVVRMPDGDGCVVDNVANDRRMVPEEVLFALCKALGA